MNTTLSATFYSSNSVGFKIPQYYNLINQLSFYKTTVFVYNQGYSNGLSHTVFSYIWKPVIYSISPTTGPIIGGSLISIKGENFLNVPSLSCFIGLNSGIAAYVSENEISCISQAATSVNSSGIIAVTFDGFENVTFANSSNISQEF